MLYSVKIEPPEVEILSGLVGQNLESIHSDGWCAEIRTSESLLLVEPEEVATPDFLHPVGDVDRPKVRIIERSIIKDGRAVIAGNPGVIQQVCALSVLITFSPPEEVPPETLFNKVVLPSGIQYGWLYFNPYEEHTHTKKLRKDRDIALIDLDIALEFTTENIPSIVLYTRGYFICVSSVGLPNEEWNTNNSFISRLLLRGGA